MSLGVKSRRRVWRYLVTSIDGSGGGLVVGDEVIEPMSHGVRWTYRLLNTGTGSRSVAGLELVGTGWMCICDVDLYGMDHACTAEGEGPPA